MSIRSISDSLVFEILLVGLVLPQISSNLGSSFGSFHASASQCLTNALSLYFNSSTACYLNLSLHFDGWPRSYNYVVSISDVKPRGLGLEAKKPGLGLGLMGLGLGLVKYDLEPRGLSRPGG